MKFPALSPQQILVLSFLVVIILGTIILSLPISKNKPLSFIDTLFTATSATCVTGLTVTDIGKTFNFLGQMVILICIQIGGLGLMTFSSLVAVLIGKSLSFKDKTIAIESFLPFPIKGISHLIKEIVIYTISIELIGAIVFLGRFYHKFSFPESVKLAIFHSISSFCNAGFSLFQDNLMSFRGDVVVNLTTIILIFLGGLGFFSIKVMTGFLITKIKKERFKIPIHFKIVLITSLLLILGGAILFSLFEWNNILKPYPFGEKLLISFFHSVTPRTAGFNTIDISMLTGSSTLLIIILMFVGASPGSTGGGIKTSTFFIILSYLGNILKGRDSVIFSSRKISLKVIQKAFTVFFLSLFVAMLSAFLLLVIQRDERFDVILFEVFSAFGTVGLSKGLTPLLLPLSKFIIILTMFIGRIGPVTLVYTLSEPREMEGISYPEEKVMVG